MEKEGEPSVMNHLQYIRTDTWLKNKKNSKRKQNKNDNDEEHS